MALHGIAVRRAFGPVTLLFASVALGPALSIEACGGAAFEAALPGASEGGTAPDGVATEAAPPDAPPDAPSEADVVDAMDAPSPDADETGGSGICPAPATLADGQPCVSPPARCTSAMPIYACGTGNVTGYVTCTCILKRWTCPLAACVDAGVDSGADADADAATPCPDPLLVRTGVACTGDSMCRGNPQKCNGTTDYDAFQCVAGKWVDLAPTVCGADL